MTQPQMLQAIIKHLRAGVIKMEEHDHVGFGVVFGLVFIFAVLAFRQGQFLAFAVVTGCLALSVPSYYLIVASCIRRSWYWNDVQQDIQGKDVRAMWDTSDRGDWLLWFAANMIGKTGWPTHQQVVLACCRCARLTIGLIHQTERLYSLKVLETTEAWTRGEVTSQDVIDAVYVEKESVNHENAEYCAMEAVRGAAWAVYARENGECFRLAQAAAQAATSAAWAACFADDGNTRDAKEAKVLRDCANIVRQTLLIPDTLKNELPIYRWVNRWDRNWRGQLTGRMRHIPVAVSRTSADFPEVTTTGKEIDNANVNPALRLATGLVTVAAICALLGALGKHPYGYYVMLRWLTCITAAMLLWRGVSQGSAKWAYLLVPVAVLFNPIIPVHLCGDRVDVLWAWHTVDVLTAVGLMVSIVFMELQVLLAKWSIRHTIEKIVPTTFLFDYTVMTLQDAEKIVHEYARVIVSESATDVPASCVSRLPCSPERIVQAMKLWLAHAIQNRSLTDEFRNEVGTVASRLPYFVEDERARRLNAMRRSFSSAERAGLAPEEFIARAKAAGDVHHWTTNADIAGLSLRGELSDFIAEVEQYDAADSLYWQRVYTLVGLEYAPRSFWDLFS